MNYKANDVTMMVKTNDNYSRLSSHVKKIKKKSKDTKISSSCQRINTFPWTSNCSAWRNLYHTPDIKWIRVLKAETYKPLTFNQNN